MISYKIEWKTTKQHIPRLHQEGVPLSVLDRFQAVSTGSRIMVLCQPRGVRCLPDFWRLSCYSNLMVIG